MAVAKSKNAAYKRRVRATRKRKMEEAKARETKKQVAILLRSWPREIT